MIFNFFFSFKKCSNEIKIANIKAFETLNNENMPTVSIYMLLSYRMKNYEIVSNITFALSGENQTNILL